MAEHRALVVVVPTAALPQTSGATLRLEDVLAALSRAGHAADVVQDLPPTGRWCTAVAVSYASAASVRGLRRLAPRVWLDAMDSWLLIDGSGLRSGRPAYLARAVRDGTRLLRMPPVDIATYISQADLVSDRRTVRATRRLVLPGRIDPPPLQASAGRRVVVVGDWGYPPNRDGLRWLAHDVLRHIDVDVDVFGRVAPDLSPRLRRHGYVADPSEMYRTGDVHLGPVRFGAGVKRKILQPLSSGLPVVTTTAGAHGLRSHPQLDVHDHPQAFAKAIERRLALPSALAPPDAGALLDGDDSPALVDWLRACTGHDVVP